MTAGSYDDTFSGITYNGSWATLLNPGASGGSIRYSATTTDSLSFTFSGQSFALIYATNSNQGSMLVFVDGTLVKNINQSSATLTWNQIWNSLPFTVGVHTVTLKHNGPGIITLDAVQIFAAQ